MTSVFFFLHWRPIRAKWRRVTCGWAGVPEGYLSPEGLSAGVSLAGEVSREEGGRSKLWTRGDITAKLRRTRWGAERRPSPRPGAGTCSRKADSKEEKMKLAGLQWEQGTVGEEGLKRELWKENFLTNYFVFSGFVSDTRKEMLCVFLRKCKFLHFIHFKSLPLGLLYWSIKFGGLKWS